MNPTTLRRVVQTAAITGATCLVGAFAGTAGASTPPTSEPPTSEPSTSAGGGAPVEQDGLVNVNLTGTSVQVPVALAASICDVEVAVLVDDLTDGAAPCPASSSSDAEITTQDSGPVEQDGLVNVNITDLVVQAPISVAANVCDVTVAALVDTAEDAAAPCDAAGAADAVTIVEPPAEEPAPVDQEGLVNVNLTGATVQVPVALAANICDLTVAVLVSDLDDGSAPCAASADSGAMLASPDGGPVEQDGLVNLNLTDLVIQLPISVAANLCDVDVAVLVGAATDAASPCDAAGVADAIAPAEGSPAVTVPDLSLPDVSVPDVSVPDVTVPELTVPEVTVGG